MKKIYIISIILVSAIMVCTSGFYAINHNKLKPAEHVEFDTNITGTVHTDVSPIENVSNSQVNEKNEPTIQQKKATTSKATEQDFENAAIMYKDGIISQEEYDTKVNNLKKSISTN